MTEGKQREAIRPVDSRHAVSFSQVVMMYIKQRMPWIRAH